MSASEAFKSGDLNTAISLSAQDVKHHPKEPACRAFFAELCCIAGDFDRADQQLNTLFTLNPELLLTVNTWRQLIRSAHARKSTYAQASAPSLLSEATDVIKQSLSLLVADNAGDAQTIQEIIGKREHQAEPPLFSINGHETNEFRDLDDINAHVWEFLSPNGEYYWVDHCDVAKIVFSTPKRVLDVAWRECEVTLTKGDTGTLFLPTIYPSRSDNSNTQLGRSTEWLERNGCVLGEGLREFVMGEEIINVNDLHVIERV